MENSRGLVGADDAARPPGVFRAPPSSHARIPALDGLRALAVLGVLAFHDDHLSGGFLGVDLFFVLSGFVVTSLLFETVSRGGVGSLGAFWSQRLRRLIPSVLVVIVTVLVVFRFAGEPAEWIPARRDAPWAQFFGANWHQIRIGTDYWDQFSVPSPFEHLWSLAIEEQFYVIWPIVIVGLLRVRRAVTVSAIVGVGAIVSAAAMWILSGTASPTRVYMGTDTRAFSLLIGACLATPFVRARVSASVARHRRAVASVSWLCVALLVVMWIVVHGDDSLLFRGEMQVHSVLSVLLIASLFRSDHSLSRLLALRPVVHVGRLSYALYLWHWPVDVYMSPDRIRVDRWTLTFIHLVVTFALSVASYHVIEVAVRYRARWARGRRGLVVLGSAMTVTTVIWLSIHIPATTNAVNADAIASFVSSTTTATPPSPSSSEQGPTETSTSVVPDISSAIWTDIDISTAYYFGDSIASDMWPAVSAAFTASGVTIESGAFGGVGLVADRDNTDPLGALGARLDELAPDLLIVQLSVWDAKQAASAQVEALEALKAMVEVRDIEVLFISFPTLASNRTNPGQSLFEMRAQQVARESDGRMVFVDQIEALGATFTFDVDGDGIPERKRDGIHVCPTGALLVARWLVNELSALAPSFRSAPIESWAYGGWRTDERYDSPPGACAAL